MGALNRDYRPAPSQGAEEDWTATLKKEWLNPITRYCATLTGGTPEQLWEGGNTKSRLDATLVDEAWREVRPHQRTTVKFALLGLLLTASDYDTSSTHYLVEGLGRDISSDTIGPSTR